MKKNIYLKRFLRIIASALIVIFIITSISYVCCYADNASEETISSFYEEIDNSLDYVVIGTSTTSRGINPVEIWKETGLKGYNLSLGAVTANVYSSILRDIVAHQRNAMIIVDIEGFTADDDVVNLKAPKDYWLDSMKKSKNWLVSIKEMDPENKVEHFFEIIKYHENIFNIKSYIMQKTGRGKEASKGHIIRNDEPIVEETETISYMKPLSGTEQLSKKSNELFNDFVELCKKEDLQNVLFVKLPKCVSKSKEKSYMVGEKRTNYLKPYIQDNGYQLLDYVALDNPIKLTKSDFLDTAHLKISGSIKYSRWLAKYLVDNYEFSTDNSKDQQWQEDYDYLKSIYVSNGKYVD